MNRVSISPPSSPHDPAGIPFAGAAAGADTDLVLREALHAIRLHLGMEVAFVAEFIGDRRVFRCVDAAADDSPVKTGDVIPLDEGYCQRIVDGRLPELIRDARRLPAALELPVTLALPIGAHLSVPIRLSDGRLYGTFCCFSRAADETLDERDLAVMRVFAELAARQIERESASRRHCEEMRRRIRSVIDEGAFSIVYQPIYHFAENRIIGFESLTRFSARPVRSPDVWFGEAAEVGLGAELEARVIGAALRGLAQLPADAYLSLNVSPSSVLDGALDPVLVGVPLSRVVLEVTEHVSIADYAVVARALKRLRRRGLRLAVDDAGAGYASFRHILELSPDLIKLDISLTRNINRNRTRRALAAALIRFAEETGSRIISEGVETPAELETLRELGVNKAQGYLIGRPMPLEKAVALLGGPGGGVADR